jgi:hypothetical protein
MLSREDFEEVLASIDRSKSIPTRLRELDIDEKELHAWAWLVAELSDLATVAIFAAGMEFGIHLARKLDEVHT